MIFLPEHWVYEILLAEIVKYHDLECANQWNLGHVKGKRPQTRISACAFIVLISHTILNRDTC